MRQRIDAGKREKGGVSTVNRIFIWKKRVEVGRKTEKGVGNAKRMPVWRKLRKILSSVKSAEVWKNMKKGLRSANRWTHRCRKHCHSHPVLPRLVIYVNEGDEACWIPRGMREDSLARYMNRLQIIPITWICCSPNAEYSHGNI